MAPRSSSSRTQKRGTSAHSSSHYATSATQMSVFFASSSTNSKETHALPETFQELKTRSTLLVSFAIPVHVSHHNPFLNVAAHPRWRKPQTLQQTQHTAKPLSCLFVCHPHLTSIIALTAVWAQPCGLEHKTSLSFSCIFGSFSSAIVFLFVLRRLVAHRQALRTTSVNSCFSLSEHIVVLSFVCAPSVTRDCATTLIGSRANNCQSFIRHVGVLVGAVSRYCHFWSKLFGSTQSRRVLVGVRIW